MTLIKSNNLTVPAYCLWAALPNKYINKCINKQNLQHWKTSHPSLSLPLCCLHWLMWWRMIKGCWMVVHRRRRWREGAQIFAEQKYGECGGGVSGHSMKEPSTTTRLSRTFRPRESKVVHSLIRFPVSHFASSPPFPPPSLLGVPSWGGGAGAGPSTINLPSNNTGTVTHYWKEMGKMNQ